jgi:hypothetical protein
LPAPTAGLVEGKQANRSAEGSRTRGCRKGLGMRPRGVGHPRAVQGGRRGHGTLPCTEELDTKEVKIQLFGRPEVFTMSHPSKSNLAVRNPVCLPRPHKHAPLTQDMNLIDEQQAASPVGLQL